MLEQSQHELSIEEAYRSMLVFLEGYYETTKSDEVGGMLGAMSLNSDGKPMDAAHWDEWMNAVRSVKESAKS